MNRIEKTEFFILTGVAMVATLEPFSMYTMSTIHALAIERIFVASVCIAVVVITIGVWRHRRWMISLGVAGNLLFGCWFLYRLWGTIQSHNYASVSCSIVPTLAAFSPFASALSLIVWGAQYCEETAQQVAAPNP